MRKAIIAVVLVLVVACCVLLIPRDKEIQVNFVGKQFVQRTQPVLNIMEEGTWLTVSEYAGKDIKFGNKHFLSGVAYKVPDIGIEETQDPWNYVNGQWFSWESADGQTYSVRIANGFTTGFKTNNSFKNVDMMYTPTFGLGITKIIEMLIFNSIYSTEIMPFVSEVSRQIKYFSEETKPSDYYLTKDKVVVNKEPILKPSKVDTIKVDKPIIDTKPAFYGTKIGETAPLFDMTLLDGRKINLSEYYGRKTVLNIWATWCGICITEFPVINEAYVKNKGANILAVCSDGTPKQIQRIKDKYSARYPCDFTMSSALGVDKVYGLKGFPTTYFLDSYGIIRYVKIGGFSTSQEVEDILNSY
jgi:peroxiredoxin